MGRYVRSVLRILAPQPGIALTLLVRNTRNAAFYRKLIGESIEIAPLRAALTRTRYDCVWYPWNGMRFRARAPAVVTINDDFAFRYPANDAIGRWREQRPIRRAVKRAARILTISEWSRTTLAERFKLSTQRIGVIPLAPDPIFSPGIEASPFAEPFVLAVGTHEARKNTAFLIDVFGRAFPAGDVRLVLVGEIDATAQLALAAAALPFTQRTKVNDEELRRLYRTATAVAVPSLAEGFGLVAAEAQACGGAVIAANASALPEAVGAGGVLVDPRDRNGWTIALRELVRNESLNALYRVAALDRWALVSAERTAQAVFALLQSAIDDRA